MLYFFQRTYSLTTIPTYYVQDETGVAASIGVPEDPNQIGARSMGGVFLTEDCKILRMIAVKPVVATATINLLPLAKEIATSCVVLIIPIEW